MNGLLVGLTGFSSAVRQMPGDLSTAPGIISLSPLSLSIDMTNVTLGESGLWLGTRSWYHRYTMINPFLSQSMVPWTSVTAYDQREKFLT